MKNCLVSFDGSVGWEALSVIIVRKNWFFALEDSLDQPGSWALQNSSFFESCV